MENFLVKHLGKIDDQIFEFLKENEGVGYTRLELCEAIGKPINTVSGAVARLKKKKKIIQLGMQMNTQTRCRNTKVMYLPEDVFKSFYSEQPLQMEVI